MHLPTIHGDRPSFIPEYKVSSITPLTPHKERQHRWHRLSGPDGIFAIKLFDSEAMKRGSTIAWYAPHSTVMLARAENAAPKRSIETRIFVNMAETDAGFSAWAEIASHASCASLTTRTQCYEEHNTPNALSREHKQIGVFTVAHRARHKGANHLLLNPTLMTERCVDLAPTSTFCSPVCAPTPRPVSTSPSRQDLLVTLSMMFPEDHRLGSTTYNTILLTSSFETLTSVFLYLVYQLLLTS